MFKRNRIIISTILVMAVLCIGVTEAFTKTVRFTLGSSNSARDLSVQSMEYWKGLLDERSNGELIMNIVPGGALGSGQQLLQQLSTNEIQLNVGGPTIVHQLMKSYQCLEAEFVYENAEHGYKVWTGDIGAELSQELEKQYDISIAGVALRGARQLTANTPIRTPDDLKGVKVRVTNPLRSQIFAAFGALPGPLPYSELYGALRQGVFDAQENPIPAIWGQKFYEVQKALNLTRHVESYYLVTANKSFIDSLSPEHRTIFNETLGESMHWLNEKVKTDTVEMIEKMKEYGTEVINPDVDAFREIAIPIIKEFAEENCRPGLLDDIAAAK